MVSIYRFYVDDALMIEASYHAFQAYRSHYSRRPLQHTMIIHRFCHDYLRVLTVREKGKGETTVPSDRLDLVSYLLVVVCSSIHRPYGQVSFISCAPHTPQCRIVCFTFRV
jgi:hypothetical protein